MDTFLILTDTPARGARLARDLEQIGPSLVIDLLDPAQAGVLPRPATVRAVISDISFNGSVTVAALKRHVDRLAMRRPRFVCLLHEDTPRSRVQARALGAEDLLPADKAQGLLAKSLVGPESGGKEHPSIAEDVARADTLLTRIFDLGRESRVDPELIAAGAALIEGALGRSDLRAWLDVVWRFDDATHQHCLLVAGLAAGFGTHIGLRRDDCRYLTEAALLHDVGKSRIPHTILNKPGRLSNEELTVMRAHPVLGHEMLRGHGYPDAQLAVVRSHHELLDGSGYPDGLRGAQLSDLVRLVTICDIFGALIERRPYKPAMAGDAAYAILRSMGDKLDRDLVHAFRPLANAVMVRDTRLSA